MKQYKYTLDKSSKKFICPKCKKRTFVKYIETETNNYLNDDFGRCDRESNCGYHSTPTGEISNAFEVVSIPKPLPSLHSLELVEQSFLGDHSNNFIDFLHSIFTPVEVKKAVFDYFISTSKRWNNATVFWQIDQLEQVHSGKILLFDSTTGKRSKDNNGKAYIDWVHSVLVRTKQITEFNLQQCLFGLHLLFDYPTKPIALVEGEKTAILLSIFKPEYNWLATGGISAFKYEILVLIKKYKIVAFPDKGEFEVWQNKAVALNKMGFQIIVNDYLENTYCEAGSDLADILIKIKKS